MACGATVVFCGMPLSWLMRINRATRFRLQVSPASHRSFQIRKLPITLSLCSCSNRIISLRRWLS